MHAMCPFPFLSTKCLKVTRELDSRGGLESWHKFQKDRDFNDEMLFNQVGFESALVLFIDSTGVSADN